MITKKMLVILFPAVFFIPAPKGEELGPVTSPPEELVESLSLSPFYEKYTCARGFPVLASRKVSDYALLEAAHLINHMLEKREDIRKAMIENKTRFVVMAYDEYTTEVPEHSDLKPARFWDRRARGLGATHARPVVSCGEENLLDFPGDHYRLENILIHEFAHAMHEMGLNSIDPDFDKRLEELYCQAMDEGLFKGTYAATNRMEYWAEGVQSWFDTNRENDDQHNHVDTREELKAYDPDLAELIKGVFGDGEWRYQKPRKRSDLEHLEGYDFESAPRFAWPGDLQKWYDEYQAKRKEKKEKKEKKK